MGGGGNCLYFYSMECQTKKKKAMMMSLLEPFKRGKRQSAAELALM